MSTTITAPEDSSVPAGFIEAMDAVRPDLPAGYWDGPSETGDGWRIETTFTFERGVAFELLPLGSGYALGVLTAPQAAAAGTALAALASRYAGTGPA
ncbi:hypothetical protein [Arthrobacter sp. AL12]|uniref:hypothetical protein n=1 Tax=Arthrobacter sp. AL12 TaxID=3042241 RepID=UPI00249A2AF2|nr:hypothetical protein [Arthrobacter sp. AL12]MDI3211705.1 hypothetical protein [Arthrobacter sp. AL12]